MRAVLAMAVALALVVPANARQSSNTATTSKSAAQSTSSTRKLLTLDPDVVKPNSFSWAPDRAPTGPVVIVVSLNEQRMHVYRNGIRIAVATISSGIAGRDTPSGSYEVLQKKPMHHSNLYSNAPMPFMQRLTWDGIALHAGYNPGHAASHGCIRMPKAFSEKLYGITRVGTRVVITDDLTASVENLIHPGDQAPIDAITGVPVAEADVGTWPVLPSKKDGEGKLAKEKPSERAKKEVADNAEGAVRANVPQTSSQAEISTEQKSPIPKAYDPALNPQPAPVVAPPQSPETQEIPNRAPASDAAPSVADPG